MHTKNMTHWVGRRGALLGAVLACLLMFYVELLPTHAQTNVDFGSSGLAGESSNNPTSLQFGPDGRLYVSQKDGTIYAYTVVRNGPNDYAVTATETINLVKNIPNYNDDGTAASNNDRQVTGIYLTGTGINPILYVTSSDPRIGAGGGGSDLNLDTNSGILSRLTCTGGVANDTCTGWEKVDLVRGLPRSEENHASNGMALDESTNTLYIAQGGHTNAGAPSNNFAFTVEYALSAAILSVDLNAINSMGITENGDHDYIYDLPTLDDPTRANLPDGSDPNDPFGGNDGLNMAKLVAGGPVQIHAAGFRNSYDVIITEAGRMYTVDNGANAGWGGHPEGEADYDAEYDANTPADQRCTTQYLSGEPGSTGPGPGGDPQVNNKNGLHYVRPLQPGDFNYVNDGDPYYGGHPNPIIANPNGAGLYFNGDWLTGDQLPVDWPPLPVSETIDAACDFRNSGETDNTIANYGPSTNGLAEYTASNFGGALQGDLLLAGFSSSGPIYRVQLSDDGKVATNCPTDTTINCTETLFSGFGSQPLDVIAQGDNDPFGGTVWAATYGSDTITVFEPADYDGSDPGQCLGTDDDTIDEDGDGYTNTDEILNGTNQCSAGSKPDDFDNTIEFNGFKRSDLLDADDDNDTLNDVDDSFARDATNGTTTTLPLRYELFNDDPGTGFAGVGFTGWMTNGSTDYLNQFVAPEEDGGIIAGGTAGLVTVVNATAGDALTTNNNQDNGFQFGIDVDTTTGPFTVSTQINSPFFNGNPPEDFQSQGMFIGTGDQDNYVKLVVTNINGTPGFEVLQETNGAISDSNTTTVSGLLTNDAIQLYLSIDPNTGVVTPQYSVSGSSTITSLAPITLTGDVLSAVQGTYTISGQPSALAVGMISTSRGSTEFSATWDWFQVEENPSNAQAFVSVDTGGINGSTFGNDSFLIENTSTGANITNVTFDLSTAILPEVVFDPDGTAGDAVSKDLTLNNGSDGGTGLTTHGFAQAYEGGFYELTIDFSDFDPSESVAFGIDIDPISIKGGSSPGPNNSGSVSGLELAGSIVTVTFDNGDVHTVELYRTQPDAVGASENIVRNLLPAAPSIQMLGVSSPETVFQGQQTVRVTAPIGANVTLLHLETGLFVEDLDGPYAGVGYDIDPYETNSVITINEYDNIISSNGYVDFAVTLLDSDPEAGYNLFAAVINDSDGATSDLSNVVIAEYNPDASPTAQYRLNTEQETIFATDGGPDWVGVGGAGVQSGNGFAVNTGNISTHNIAGRDSSVPNYAPQALFDKERWDSATAPEMLWNFDVAPGTYTVNLFMGNGFSGTSQPGERVFDIEIEGQLVEDNLDLSATFGHQVGGMKSYNVNVTDNSLDIEFLHVIENPTLNAIEILSYDGSVENPIQLDPIANQANIEGDDISNNGLAVSATGGDGNLSYSATGLPPGVDLEPTNGQFFGIVADGAAANSPYSVTVTVDDSDDNTSDVKTTTFVWTIFATGANEVLYRVNIGGTQIAAADGSLPDWSQDTGAFGDAGNSPYLTAVSTGTSTYSGDAASAHPGDIIMTDPSLPPSAPAALFNIERFDEATTPEMLYQFPVPAGTQIQVNLFFAELLAQIDTVGERVFDVAVDGVVPTSFNDIDPFASAGAKGAFMRSYQMTSDGSVDIEFLHVIENPALKGIEILAIGDGSTNLPPVVNVSDRTDGVLSEYDSGRYLVDATDPDGDTLTFSATGLPTGLTIDPVSGEIQGIIDASASTGGTNGDGVFTVEVSVSDDADPINTTVATFTWTVVERTLTILSPSEGATVLDSGFTVEWETTGGATDVYEHVHLYLLGGIYDDTTWIGSLPLVGSQAFPNATYPTLPAGDYQLELRMAYPTHVEMDPSVVVPDVVNITIEEDTTAQPQVCVNAGGADFTLSNGRVFEADATNAYYDVGNTFSTTSDIVGTTDDLLYQTERYGGSSTTNPPFTYTFPVDNGAYVVDLYFAEIFHTSAGARVFNVDIEGATVLSDFDLVAEAGAFTPVLRSFQTTVLDGQLEVFFYLGANGVDNAKVSGICVIPTDIEPALVIDPPSIDVTLAVGETTDVQYTVDSNDGSTLPTPAQMTDIDAATSQDATWMSTTSAANQGTPYELTLDASNLAPGTYNGSLIAGSVSGYADAEIPVTLTVVPEIVPQALFEVTPGSGLDTSTYTSNSFQLTNQSTGGATITSFSLDLSTAILPDMVFDPTGDGGDETAKCFTPNSGAAATGLIAPTDPCIDPFSVPRNGGWDVMTVDFNDFDAGESFFFAVDIDPNSIQGVGGAGAAGSVSGYELVGATMTLTFSDGSVLVSNLYEDGSLGGSQTVITADAPAAPSIAAQGVTTPATVTDANQTIIVSGTPDDYVSLLQMDSRLYIASGEPPFGVSDTTYYANEAMSGKVLYTAQIGTGGTVSIPVTLLQTDSGDTTPDGGINNFMAVTSATPYAVDQPVSQTSNLVILKYDPTAATATLDGSISLQGRSDNSGTVTVELYAASGATTPLYTFTPTVNAAGDFTITDIVPGTYQVAVKHPQSLQVVETTTLVAGINTVDFGTLPIGDANDDNVVSGVDFSILVSTFNLVAGDTGYDARADFNGDGLVSGTDFSLLVSNFNATGEEPTN